MLQILRNILEVCDRSLEMTKTELSGLMTISQELANEMVVPG